MALVRYPRFVYAVRAVGSSVVRTTRFTAVSHLPGFNWATMQLTRYTPTSGGEQGRQQPAALLFKCIVLHTNLFVKWFLQIFSPEIVICLFAQEIDLKTVENAQIQHRNGCQPAVIRRCAVNTLRAAEKRCLSRLVCAKAYLFRGYVKTRETPNLKAALWVYYIS